MIDKGQVHKLLMTAMKTSDEVGRLDACLDIVNKLCEVTKEEKDMIIAVLRSVRGRQYVKGENAYWEIDRVLKEEPTVSKMEQVALKPCPFCAYPVKLETIRHRVGYYYEIQCTNAMCGTSMWDEEKEDLITKWNRRVEE